MTLRTPRSIVVVCLLAAWVAAAPATQPWHIAVDHADGIYRVGETIHCKVNWQGDGPPPPAKLRVLEGQSTLRSTVEVYNGSNETDYNPTQPGTVLMKVESADGKAVGVAGAVCAPDQIRPCAAKPDDFDTFWEDKLKELAAVPPNPQLTPGDAGRGDLEYSLITMNNIRGTHIRGQIAKPRKGEKFPALLIVQWAGVYALDKSWVTGQAAQGWLALDINAHDLPIDKDAKFYKDQFDGPLKDYWAIGNEDRDTSYFLRMYLSCYRAAEYLTQRPDWNGKTLVVMGGSQGGLQSLMTAAIHPKITAALADVPAGCDMLGPDAGRKGGWPQWYDQIYGKDAAKVRAASRYYDVVNFAPRIKCPILVGAGLIDEVCPAAGILAAVNQVAAPKEIHLFPIGPHGLEQQTHTLYNDAAWKRWLPTMVKDEPAPVHPGID